jgi:hypothetical protein
MREVEKDDGIYVIIEGMYRKVCSACYNLRNPQAMQTIDKPTFRIWIPGRPLSGQKGSRSSSRYAQSIRDAAQQVVPYPSATTRIDVEIWYKSSGTSRPDVDNVAKPILDALKGLVYLDDEQVRSVRIVALPANETYSLGGWVDGPVFFRLIDSDTPEFLIAIWHGISIHGLGP